MKIAARIEGYRLIDPPRHTELVRWKEDYVDRLLKRLDLRCVPWESLIESIGQRDPQFGEDLGAFYERCLKENRPPDYSLDSSGAVRPERGQYV
jgi:hypothetical protein